MNSQALATPPMKAARIGTTMMYRPALTPKVSTSPAAKNSADVIVLGDSHDLQPDGYGCRAGRTAITSPGARVASTVSSR